MAGAAGGLPPGLKPLAGQALEGLLNRLLDLDPDTRLALSDLDGRQVEADFGNGLALSVRVDGSRLRVGPPASGDASADLSVRGSLGAVLSQFQAFAPRDGRRRPGVHVSGDAGLARELQKLLRGYDPDWSLPLSAVFGEVAGAQMARALREGLVQAAAFGRGMARDVADYVVEERADVAGAVEIDAFNDAVDALRERAERLERRVQRLIDPGR